MQLDLGNDPRTELLRRLHQALIDRFGRIIRPPEKRRDPVWVLVQGVVGARTKTLVSNENADRLIADFGSWDAVAEAPLEELTAKLKTATFSRTIGETAERLFSGNRSSAGSVTLDHLHNVPTAEAMDWLETLPGIARKISAGIMNTSTFNRKAMVIETGHCRILQRMGLIHPKADIAKAYDEIMPILPEEWTAEDMDEHHLLVKRLGQVMCRPKIRTVPNVLPMICANGTGRGPYD